MLNDAEVREQVQRAESLLDKVETLDDEQARLIAVQTVQAIIGLYGEALARIVAHAGEHPDQNGQEALLQTLSEDELISHLLLVHDLHPLPVQSRVQQALADLASYLQSQGAEAEVLGVQDGVAHVRLAADCSGCDAAASQRSVSAELKTTVEQVVLQAAPELLRVQLADEETPSAAQRATGGGFVPLTTLTPAKERESHG